MNEQLVHIDHIHGNPYQHREQYKDIEELGRAIAAVGLQQIPKARKNGKGYELKFGHRRFHAFEWLHKNWKAEGLTERYSGYAVMPLDLEELSDREMFDAMVIENIHRDDLKPTEVAFLLKQYQETYPEATSREIGLVFGMNESTVRGTVRLLELTEEGKKALDEGKISQGTARSLLSMQKIAPAAEVKATIKYIEENPDQLPEEIIEEQIGELDNAVHLWGSSNGTPLAGHNGWPLDMKRFPNELLPTLDQTDGMTEEGIEHLTNPPACAVCPFYTKVRGSHYCGAKACYERKWIAWSAHLIENASKKMDIVIYDEADGPFKVLDWQDEALFKRKNKGLRLIPRAKVGGYYWQSFSGVNDKVFLVVATGDTIQKLKSHNTSTKGKKTEEEKAEMRAMKLYRQLRKEVLWEYCGIAQKHFDGIPLTVLEFIEQHTGYVGIDDRIPDEHELDEKAKATAKMEFKRREIVWNLIFDLSSHYHREPLIEQLNAFAERMAIKPTKSLVKKIEMWDAEINALAKVTSAKPSVKGKKK